MKRPIRLVLALAALLAFVGAACGDDDTETTGSESTDTTAADQGAIPDGPAISIGAQDFGESAILSEIYAQGLADSGYETGTQELGGFRDLAMAALDRGEINFSPEYAAAMLEFLNEQAGEATSDAEETVGILQGYLDDLELTALDVSDAVDTNSFVVTRATADEVGLETLSDLAEKGADLTLGGPADCETNPFCIPGLQTTYDLDLSANFQSLEAGAIADTLDAGAIDIGIIFSTDGRIDERDWVLLEDDKKMLAADNVVPVVSDELVEVYGDAFVERVNEISAALTTEALTELNKRYDVDKEDAADIAADWLEENDLLS